MTKGAVVYAERAWRNVNRRLSRAYVSWFAKKESRPDLVRLGSSYGGWYAPKNVPDGALCYCIGVGLDATFDFELAKTGAEVHSFDPTPVAIDYIKENDDKGVHFHPWGLWNQDTKLKFHVPIGEDHGSHFVHDLHRTGKYHEVDAYKLSTMMEKLGHEEVFLLKMDIEGSWYEALLEFIPSGIHPKILGIEFDSPAPVWRVAKIVKMLQSVGYTVANQEKDNVTFVKSS